METARRGERLARECPWRRQIAVELCWLRSSSRSGRINCRDARILRFRKAEPDVERKRFTENTSPIFAQCLSRDAPHEFIEKKSEGARMITVSCAGGPKRRLSFEGGDYRRVIQYIDARIERGETGLMREQLRQRDFLFAGLREFRPEVCDAP